ncbi:porin [Cytophagaceae bacterium 50C-KIRBA]|uniref:Porin n=1 Tax=Aquirufa beregesia TaxID=2516556 RepID=A0ABX0ET66_9BACT|nr:porin [Aquirufa beregesia]NGZ43645.1 porin [Aquirufa beregesia]
MKKFILLIFSLITQLTFAQSENEKKPLIFSGYLESYFSYDFNNPTSGTRPNFIYSHNRHNELTINLAFIKAAYQQNNVRANLSLATGSYMNANLASEPGVLKNIYEANVGVQLSQKLNLWLDAGIFSSHIGFESAISKDCWTLTRSIMADNSPYYESGIKVTYLAPNKKWLLSGLLLNGWQRIQRIDGNSTLALGHQLTFTPNKKITINSSSFIGNDKPDSTKLMRYFHNWYGIFQLSKKVAFTAGFDLGFEQKNKNSADFYQWYSTVLILKISPTSRSNIVGRVEYYSDPNGIIISNTSPQGFQTWSYSINYDYSITENTTWRIEGRKFTGNNDTFHRLEKLVSDDFTMTTSLAISF